MALPPFDLAQPIPVATFRAYMTAFADAAIYPDDLCGFYLSMAHQYVRPERWAGDSFAWGQMLWAAHFITLDAWDSKAAAAGKPAGSVSGLATSKSVGAVSVGYDMTTASEEGAGHWNQTSYGRRFWAMMNLAGMGGIQLTGLSGSLAPI